LGVGDSEDKIKRAFGNTFPLEEFEAIMKSAILLRRTIGAVCVGSVAITAFAGVLVPGEDWPLAWVRYREYKGEFAGRPVVVVPPPIRRETVPLEYHIQMTSGACQIAWIDQAGQIVHYTAMGFGYAMRSTLSAGERLQLDPGSNEGRYMVRMGLKYHLLSPFLWRRLGAGTLAGLTAFGLISLFRRRYRMLWLGTLRSRLTDRQWGVLIAFGIFSCVILYPIVHESGHALAGLALGGRIAEVAFTALSGDTPHVKFSYLPDDARPWMNAAGVFLPILVAYGLLAVWFGPGRGLSVFRQVLLLTPAVLFLVSGFGIDDHLRGMAEQLGCTSEGSVLLVKTIPAWLALAAYAAIGWRFWRLNRRDKTEAGGDRNKKIIVRDQT
jgi:hypothetical protein